MVQHLNKSKHGEGIGGPIEETRDPDSPSFDPATHESQTDRKIRDLLTLPPGTLTKWEREFITQIYGEVPLPRRAHVKVAKLHRAHFETVAPS